MKLFIPIRLDVHKVILFTVAVVSFFPSFMFLLLLTLALIALFFRTIGYKYALLYLGLSIPTFLSSMMQSAFHVKGYFLAFATFSSIFYVFYARYLKYDPKYLFFFLRLHILFSVLQVPVQVVNFIAAWGMKALNPIALVATNSSAGDEALGTIHNSAFLADKQILSLFFLIFLRKQYGREKFWLYLCTLGFSFLTIGANHTTLALIVSLLLWFLITRFSAHSFSASVKQFATVALILAAITVLSIYVFSSQIEYATSVFGRFQGVSASAMLERGSGKARAFINTTKLLEKHKEYAITGLGMGAYASRAAFILSGDYLWQGAVPGIGTERSDSFELVMHPLWNREIEWVLWRSGTIDMPFSSYLAIGSESGLLVLCCFLILIARICLYFFRRDDFMLLFCIFISGMLCIDNFLEAPPIIAPTLFLIFSLYKNGRYYRDQQGQLHA